MGSLTEEECARLFDLVCAIDHGRFRGGVCDLCVIMEKLRRLAGDALPEALRPKARP